MPVSRLLAHPLWLAGFRPFFALACVAGLIYPLFWALIFVGAVSPAPTFALDALTWHAHEMFFGFGLAVLGGFLLTASKNWLAIRGYHGLAVLLLVLAWLFARALINLGHTLPPLWLALGSSLYTAGLVAMLLASLIRHRKNDSYPDNLYFILVLPMLLPAQWLLLTPGSRAIGIEMSLAIFRLAFLIMLERTLTQFMRGLFQISLPRHLWLDHGIKTLATGLVVIPLIDTTPPALPALRALLYLALAIMLAARWLAWSPMTALRRLDVGIMYLAQLALILQLLLEAHAALTPAHWIGSVSVHLFTLGVIGFIVPAMIVRIARGHTGRKVMFDHIDRGVLWLMIAALVIRVGVPQLWPGAYSICILGSAILWAAGFGTLAWRYIPWLLAARADGKAH